MSFEQSSDGYAVHEPNGEYHPPVSVPPSQPQSTQSETKYIPPRAQHGRRLTREAVLGRFLIDIGQSQEELDEAIRRFSSF